MSQNRAATSASYDSMADAYATRYGDELSHKPLDRALLHAFADEVFATGDASSLMVADVGCGPGHIARFVHELGLPVCGVDLSPAMCALARTRNPGATIYQAAMDAIPVDDAAWSAIVAFYALCHIPKAELPAVFAEFARVLRPEGLLLVAFHGGDEVQHVDEELGAAVDLDFHFHEAATLSGLLNAAGFDVQVTVERRAYQPWEVATRRVYVQARRNLTQTESG